MRAVLILIGAVVLAMAVGGLFVLRGGEYAMFLLALALVCFFGALPVVFGVLSRPRSRPHGTDGVEEIVPRDPRPPASTG